MRLVSPLPSVDEEPHADLPRSGCSYRRCGPSGHGLGRWGTTASQAAGRSSTRAPS